MERNVIAVTVAGLAVFLWRQSRSKGENKEEKLERWFEKISLGRIPDSMISVASTPGQGTFFSIINPLR